MIGLRPISKVVLSVGIIALASALVLLFRPWESSVWMEFNYVKKNALEIAEAIELNKGVRVKRSALVNKTLVTIEVLLPNEEPLRVDVEYSKIQLRVPISGDGVLRGKDVAFAFEKVVTVYHEGKNIIVDPKPVVNYTLKREYDRDVHVVTLILFKIPYDTIVEGSTIYPSKLDRHTYVRTYSYSGTSKVYINGVEAFSFAVNNRDVLELVVVLCIWDKR